MGRGRAKAKQQKVARELKYSSHFTDLDALARELGSSSPAANGSTGDADPDAEDADFDDSDADGRSAAGH
jgi:hypothetical protein